MSKNSLGRVLALRVLDALNGRKGYDQWWDNVDDDLREEIIDKLAIIINEGIPR